jgi:hypothetical protein
VRRAADDISWGLVNEAKYALYILYAACRGGDRAAIVKCNTIDI